MEKPDPFGFASQDNNAESEIGIKGKKAEKVFSLNKPEKKVKVEKKDRLKSRREIRILAETQSSAESLKFGFKVFFYFLLLSYLRKPFYRQPEVYRRKATQCQRRLWHRQVKRSYLRNRFRIF